VPSWSDGFIKEDNTAHYTGSASWSTDNGATYTDWWHNKHLHKSFCEVLSAKSHNLPRARGAALTISFAWVLNYHENPYSCGKGDGDYMVDPYCPETRYSGLTPLSLLLNIPDSYPMAENGTYTGSHTIVDADGVEKWTWNLVRQLD
jgi:hypothetical protein